MTNWAKVGTCSAKKPVWQTINQEHRVVVLQWNTIKALQNDVLGGSDTALLHLSFSTSDAGLME